MPQIGVFNGVNESGYSDVPLSLVNLLSAGNHTLYVHGKDAAGNWGATSTTILNIDKVGPTTSALTLDSRGNQYQCRGDQRQRQ